MTRGWLGGGGGLEGRRWKGDGGGAKSQDSVSELQHTVRNKKMSRSGFEPVGPSVR